MKASLTSLRCPSFQRDFMLEGARCFMAYFHPTLILLSYSGIWPGRNFFLSWCHFLFATLVIDLEHYTQFKSWFNWSCLAVALRLCYGIVFEEKIPFFSRRVRLTTVIQTYILKWSYWPKILAPFLRTLYFLTFIILTYGCRVGDPLYNEDVLVPQSTCFWKSDGDYV